MSATRTTRPRLPEFLTSPIVGGLIAAVLSEAADRTAADSQEGGRSAISGALVTTIKRASQEIADYVKAGDQ